MQQIGKNGKILCQGKTARNTLLFSLTLSKLTESARRDSPNLQYDALFCAVLVFYASEVRFFNVGQIEALQSLHLSGANLRYMKMESRFLEGIDLRGADVFGSHFSAANLSQADLRDANLRRTRLDVSNLASARLDDAVLAEAVVSRARMMEASLRDADLGGAILAGADLTGADLYRARLVGTDLTEADLTGVRGLQAEQLAEACADAGRPPTLPEGFSPPPVCEE